jgi:CNT family concentrative nucleoside transporter
MKFKVLILVFLLLFLFPVLTGAQIAPQLHNISLSDVQDFSFTSFLRSFFGLGFLVGLGYLFSTNRKAINWRVVIIGLMIQFLIAIAVMKIPVVQMFFEFIGRLFIKILDSSNAGSDFLFKSLVSDKVEVGLYNFAFRILPTIIFFSALTSILYYYGIIQKIVLGLAWLLKKALKLGGAESLVTISNIFIGQIEAVLLVKQYVSKMSRSEIMLIMVAGMATMAGGVLTVYIGLLGGTDPASKLLFAKHLVTASVMAAPGAVVMAKMLLPQTEPIQTDIRIPKSLAGSNALDSISNGTAQGLKIAVSVGATLLVFIAFIYLINFILLRAGDWTSLNSRIINLTNGQYQGLSMQFLLGYSLAPLVWLLGVGSHDMTLVAQLFGEKIIMNEMVGYISLKDFINSGVFTDPKSIIMSVYVLCGFANFSSVGIQIGGIGALAPEQRTTLTKLGLRAMLAGGMASLVSAAMIGMILG